MIDNLPCCIYLWFIAVGYFSLNNFTQSDMHWNRYQRVLHTETKILLDHLTVSHDMCHAHAVMFTGAECLWLSTSEKGCGSTLTLSPKHTLHCSQPAMGLSSFRSAYKSRQKVNQYLCDRYIIIIINLIFIAPFVQEM